MEHKGTKTKICEKSTTNGLNRTKTTFKEESQGTTLTNNL